ncbi:Apyrase [Dictyocaulus viviparus]|uniref:Apyrase n=1 Tax=Dictyocaulus viviparus TaxID=29172 RepID=A0A0D8XF45_DICVI|nr:Apyrase [Dictyocaulus viviparus]
MTVTIMHKLLLSSSIFVFICAKLFHSELNDHPYSKRNSIYDYNPFNKDYYDYDEVFPRVVHVHILPNGTRVYDLLAVTDMDMNETTSTNWTWRAVARKGKLLISKNKKNITIIWRKDSDKNLTTHLNYKGRAMELSDLSELDGRLLSPDDKTGMLYEIKGDKAIPWLFLNSGSGRTTRGMKAEWTTLKGKHLYVGGHGTECRDENGTVLNEDAMWIKIISKHGEVISVNWKKIYKRLRKAANITAPGYLTHEAVQWSEYHRGWFFLPRKESRTIYVKTEDEQKGSNLLIIGNRNLKHFKTVRIGKLDHPERGYTAFDFIPGTRDKIIVAVKSEEVEGKPPRSFITVFDIRGNVLLEDQELIENYKFEGIYFV